MSPRPLLVLLPGLLFLAALTASVESSARAGSAPPVDGARLYSTSCLVCHGVKGDGKGPAGIALKPPPTNFTLAAWSAQATDDQIKAAIRAGVPGTSMKAYPKFQEAELNALVLHLRTFKK